MIFQRRASQVHNQTSRNLKIFIFKNYFFFDFKAYSKRQI